MKNLLIYETYIRYFFDESQQSSLFHLVLLKEIVKLKIENGLNFKGFRSVEAISGYFSTYAFIANH